MPVINFSGLATGLDTNALVDSLIEIARQPIVRLEEKQAINNSKTKKFTSFDTKLTAIQTAAAALNTSSKVLASSVSSSDEDKITATAEAGAAIGTYEVEITSLASVQRTMSNGYAAQDEGGLFTDGQIEMLVDDQAYYIDVTSSDTLTQVLAKFQATGANITSSIVFDGTNYLLQVAGKETGEENAIVFRETGPESTGLGFDDEDNEVSAASDAEFTVDGVAMTRTNNMVADAIPGVTFELLEETDDPVKITVGRDVDASIALVQAFVDAYNSISKDIATEFAPPAQEGGTKALDTLSGDSGLRGIQSLLRRTLSRSVTGGDQLYDSALSIGIKTAADGSLTFNTTTFTEAMADDPEAVATLLSGSDSITGLMNSFEEDLDLYTDSDGFIDTRLDTYTAMNKRMDDQIASLELRIEKYEQGLRAQFTALETLISGLNSQRQQFSALTGG